MQQRFFKRAGPFPLSELAAHLGITPPPRDMDIQDICTLDEAGPGDISFFENRAYLSAFEATKAGACLVTAGLAKNCPASTIPLIVDRPYTALGSLLALFYPAALVPQPLGIKSLPEASEAVYGDISKSTYVEPGAIVAPGVKLGPHSVIGAGAVVGPHVEIGAHSYIGPACVVQHALIGDHVILHPGVKVGQDGFGYAYDQGRHIKIPQVGRVVIGSHVEVGANTTIDRGALRDTVIGEGTKIDNLVQIGHNVQIGKHCIIVGQVGISGSVILEDNVMIGGKSSVAGHVTIGKGAQIAAVSTVKDDVPAGARYGGVPAKPVKQWFREMAALSRLAERSKDLR